MNPPPVDVLSSDDSPVSVEAVVPDDVELEPAGINEVVSSAVVVPSSSSMSNVVVPHVVHAVDHTTAIIKLYRTISSYPTKLTVVNGQLRAPV
jgi:hypothetical protein